MELMDQGILAAVEEAFHFGFPARRRRRAGDRGGRPGGGPRRAAAADRRVLPRMSAPARCSQAAAPPRARAAVEVPQAGRRGRGPAEPQLHDPGRRGAAHPAAAHPPPHRPKSADKHGMRIVNVAHAGDGNVHPILLFDERDRGQVERARGGRPRDARGVHRLRRQHHRRARHRRGEDRPDGAALRRRATWQAMRRVRAGLRSAGRLNPGKLLREEPGKSV